MLPPHAGCQVSKETSSKEPLQSHDRTGMHGQPCPRCSGLDSWVGTGQASPATPRGELSKSTSSLRPTISQQHGAASLIYWGNPNKYPQRPELGDDNTRNLVQWHFQTCMAHSQPGCDSTPNLDMVSFPASLWLHSQLWVHFQAGHSFIPSLAVAAQEALPRLPQE